MLPTSDKFPPLKSGNNFSNSLISSQKVSKADCTNSSINSLLGICLNAVGTGDPITILLQGFVVTDVFASYASYQPGLPLYLSTSGRITDAAPGGGQNRIIGHYYRELVSGTYSIRFNPDNYWV